MSQVTNAAAGRRATILVVDDEPNNTDMLARRLQRQQYRVDVANSGEDALARMSEKTYDVTLLDVMMPGLNGLAVLDRIRTGQCHADVPVIMVTAVSDTEEVVRAFRAGADDYVTKPINFQILNARLQSQLRRRQHEWHASQVVWSSLEQDLVERWLGCWDCQRELLRRATEAPLSLSDVERLQAFEPLHLDTVRPLLDAMLRACAASGHGADSDEAPRRP